MLNKSFVGRGEVKDFKFEQAYADSKWYVYEVSSYGTAWFEVFLRRKVNGKEVYPKSKHFGLSAWQVVSLEKALLKIAGFQERDTLSGKEEL